MVLAAPASKEFQRQRGRGRGGRSGGGGRSGDGGQTGDLALLEARVIDLEGTMSKVAAALLRVSGALSDSAEFLETAAMSLAEPASWEFHRQKGSGRGAKSRSS